MYTYFLSSEQVKGYMLDLSMRLLETKKHDRPTVLVSIGASGNELAYHLININETSLKWAHECDQVRCDYDRNTKQFSFAPDDNAEAVIEGATVLIIDSAVHSGNTMRKAVEHVEALKPKCVTTYSLVVKQSSVLIPNLFGLLIDRHDRAYFLLQRIPNLRIMRSGCLRPMEEKDIGAAPIDCGVASINKFGWPELWYDLQADNRRKTYVYERDSKPLGYITYRLLDDGHILIDVVAVDKSAKGGKIGANLIRWAETCARSANCTHVVLWGLVEENVLRIYVGAGYDFVKDKEMKFPDETYALMKKAIVHDSELDELLHID